MRTGNGPFSLRSRKRSHLRESVHRISPVYTACYHVTRASETLKPNMKKWSDLSDVDFSETGFYSVVQPRKNRDELIIRTRFREDLDSAP